MKRACLCTQRSGSNLRKFGVFKKMFKQSIKIEVKKEMTDELQKKNKTIYEV